jgi:hypothetical protein
MEAELDLRTVQARAEEMVAQFSEQYIEFKSNMELLFPVWKRLYNEEKKLFNATYTMEDAKKDCPHIRDKHKITREYFENYLGYGKKVCSRCTDCQWEKEEYVRENFTLKSEDMENKLERWAQPFEEQFIARMVRKTLQEQRERINEMYKRPRVEFEKISFW